MKRVKPLKITFSAFFIVSLILLGVYDNKRVYAEISTPNGYYYNYNGYITNPSGYEYEISRPIYEVLESIREPQGFEQNGGGFLSATIPFFYVFYNQNDNKYYFQDNIIIETNKYYENGIYYYEDIILRFGVNDDYLSGLYYIRFDGLNENLQYYGLIRIDINFKIYVPTLQPLNTIQFLDDYGYTDISTDTDFLYYYSMSETFTDVGFNDTLAYQNGVNSVLNNPSQYQLFTFEQRQEYGNQQYNEGLRNGLATSDGDLVTYGNIMTTTFGAIGDILNVQIFPHITIGLVIGIPILLGLFLIIVKFIRG